jgi:hypothetical protein
MMRDAESVRRALAVRDDSQAWPPRKGKPTAVDEGGRMNAEYEIE